MLDKMREHSRSAVIYVFFIIIIVVFVFSFGPGSSGCRSGAGLGRGSTWAAMVNGKPIPISSYENAYARRFREYQQRGGGSFTPELAKAIRLRETVLDQLVDWELLAQEAQKQGLAISDRELAEKIHSMGVFQQEGRFSAERYRLIVEHEVGTSPVQFEEELRRSMLTEKMVGALAASVKVADDEARAEYVKEKDKVDLAYVRFAPQQMKAEAPAPTDAQVDQYLKDNAAKLEEAWKKSEKYHQPRRVRARHILAKVAQDAPAADVASAQKRIDEAKKALAGGTDFAEVAKKTSDDPGSKDKGGDLGVFKPGTMDPKFEEAAFALGPGEVSAPVRTQFGIHLIKCEEQLPASERPLKEVERELARDELVDGAVRELAKKRAQETLEKAALGKALAELWPSAKKPEEKGQLRFDLGSGKPEAEETGPFSPSSDYIPRVGVDAEAARAVLALTPEKPAASRPYEVNGSFYAFVLKSRERPDLKELDVRSGEYKDKVRQKKLNDAVESFVGALKARAHVERNVAAVEGRARARAEELDDG